MRSNQLVYIGIGIVICLILLSSLTISDINEKIESEKKELMNAKNDLSNYTTVKIGENRPLSVEELSAKRQAEKEGYDEYKSLRYSTKKEYEGKTVKIINENKDCPYCDNT